MDVDHRLDALLRALAEQGNAAKHELEQQRRHQRALGVMEETRVAERILGIAGLAERTLTERDQVFDDRPGFDQRMAVMLNHRRLAERVHLPELRRGEHGGLVPLIALDFVRQPELLEQPEDALRAAVLEVMDDYGHSGISRFLRFGRGLRQVQADAGSLQGLHPPPRFGDPGALMQGSAGKTKSRREGRERPVVSRRP